MASGFKKFTAICLCIAAFGLPSGEVHAELSREYQIKAAFIYNFAQFVEWPDKDRQRPLVIGIAGTDPFGEHIDALQTETLQGRRIIIRRFTEPEEARKCDIVYVSRDGLAPLIFDAVKGTAVLTVGENKAFVQKGGMIAFSSLDNRVRFIINKSSADRAGIRISSQLFALAMSVL